jgi:biotin transport system substrate-specific component
MTLAQAALAVLIFIPGDLVKCVLSALVVRTVAQGLPQWDRNLG